MDDQPQDQTPPEVAPVDQPQPAKKALPWSAVLQKPEFQALKPEQQEQARQQYFRDVVSPQVPEQFRTEAQQQFDKQTGQSDDWLRADPTASHPSVIEDMLKPIARTARSIGKASMGEERPPGYPTGKEMGPDTVPVSQDLPNTVAGFSPASMGSKIGKSLAGTAAEGGEGLLSKVGEVAGKAKDAMTPEAILPNEKLYAAGSKIFTQADAEGGFLPSNYTNAWLDKFKAGVKPDDAAAVNVRGGPSDLSAFVERMEKNRGKPISYNGLDQIYRDLGDQVTEQYRLHKGLTDFGRQLYRAQQLLKEQMLAVPDDALPGGQTAQVARKVWEQASKLREAQDIVTRGGYTKNPATSIATQFKNLVTNNKKTRGWDENELAAAEKAASTGVATDFLQAAGNRLGTLVGASAGAKIGLGVAGPIGAVVGAGAGAVTGYTAGNAARGIATGLQNAKGAAVNREILKNLPPGILQRIQSGEFEE